MTLLAISFLSGVLTVLAPCILPLLPVVVGSAAAGRSRATPYIVVASVSLSIILFTFLLKVSTLFIMVPEAFWTYVSGGILIFLGITFLIPSVWERLPGINRLSRSSNKLVGAGYQKKSFWGDVLIGAALGPVFSSCSPTYFVILASVLPASFALGTAYLLAYTTGLAMMLILIALIGQRFADRLMRAADSRGAFKRIVGIIFIALGLLIASGYEKKFEIWLLESGFVDAVRWEQNLLQRLDAKGAMPTFTTDGKRPFVEIKDPAGFVNTEGITIGELVGKKVVLIDFMTYSCINCQRTFPYMTAWYERYRDQGLEIVGIHTPEFAFEKNIDNVRAAMEEVGITYPVVLDNDYATWRAYGNQYWPRKYLIDIEGNIIYDHIGEGGYVETEMMIRRALQDRALKLGEPVPNETEPLVATMRPEEQKFTQSPEIYFGAWRNERLVGGKRFLEGEQTLTLPDSFTLNALYLGGTWRIAREYAESTSDDARIVFRYRARDVFMVASSDDGVDIEILQEGVPVTSAAGEDVIESTLHIQDERLYKLIRNPGGEEHTLEIKVKGGKLKAFTFTFG
jgi:cytochrome c biogenesis protein CcdA/thiol-disulfide isomerase/thioredoxin